MLAFDDFEIKRVSDEVDALLLALVVRAHDDFGEKPDQRDRDAGGECHDNEKRERSQNEGDSLDQLQVECVNARCERYEETQEPEPAEHINRLRGIAVEELDNDHIEYDFCDPFQTVFRATELPPVMLHRYFGHAATLPMRIDRNEPVHFTVEPHAFDDVLSIR